MGNKFCKEGGDADISISVPDEPLIYSISEYRRSAVFNEAYNPEEDDNQNYPDVIHPKSDYQRQMLQSAAKNDRGCFLFRTLDDSQLKQVIDAMFEKKVVTGEFLINEGEDGDLFFIIEKGNYKVIKEWDTHTENLTNKGFGEIALLYKLPRLASVQATTDGLVWAIERQTFRKIVIRSAFRKRKMYESFLENVPLLENLEKNERENLADALKSKTYSAGQAVVKEGDIEDGMYFIEAGTLAVLKQIEGEEEKVKEIQGPGQYFGEMGLITEYPRKATVTATDDVKLAILDRLSFEQSVGTLMDVLKRNTTQDDFWALYPPTEKISPE